MIALIRFRGRFLCAQLVIALFLKSSELNLSVLTLLFCLFFICRYENSVKT